MNICKDLLRNIQYNTHLMGQDGHGIFNPELVKQHKLDLAKQSREDEIVNEDDTLQAPKVRIENLGKKTSC